MGEFGENDPLERFRKKPYIETTVPGRYQLRVTRGYEGSFPPEFYNNPFNFMRRLGEVIKSGANTKGQYGLTEVKRIVMPDGSSVISKRYLPDKNGLGHDTKEFDVLMKARRANLPGAIPIASIVGFELDDGSYTLMSDVPGRSGRFIDRRLLNYGMSLEQIEDILQQIQKLYAQVVHQYQSANIDKPEWHSKDVILQMSRNKGRVYGVIPIDFERAIAFDPRNPGRIIVDRTI